MKQTPRIVFTVLTLLVLLSGCGSTATIATAQVSPVDAAGIIEQNSGSAEFVILDIRTAQEFGTGKIAGAVNIDFYASDFREQVDALDKNNHYLVYRNSGNRSSQALPIFEDLGFAEVNNLTTGIQGWLGEGYAVVP